MSSDIIVADRYPSVDSGEIFGGSMVRLICNASIARYDGLTTIWVSPVGSYQPTTESGLSNLSIVQVPVGVDTLSRYYLAVGAARVWMIMHGMMSALPVDGPHDADWSSFVEVNRLVGQAVAACAPRNARVTVHDYTLLLSVLEIHKRRPDLTIAYVHHVPWPHRASVVGARSLALVSLLIRAAEAADGISVSAAQWHGNVRSWSNKVHARIAHPGVDVTELKTRVSLAKGRGQWARHLVELERPIIATVGRADPSKNVDTVLRAWIDLLSTGAPGTLCVHQIPSSRRLLPAYSSYAETVAALVREANRIRPTSVILIEEEDQTDALQLLEQADIVAVCSRSDGWNLVAVEAAALGPESQHIVLSAMVGAVDLLGPIATVVIDPLNVTKLARALGAAIVSGPDNGRIKRRELCFPSLTSWAEAIEVIHTEREGVRGRKRTS